MKLNLGGGLTVAAVAVLLAGLAGCGAVHTESAAAAPQTAPAAASAEAKKSALMTAAEGYVNAMLSGDVVGITGYLDPATCGTDEDKGGAALGATSYKQTAQGATMKVTGVYVDGDRGGVDTYELSAGAPDALRRSIKESFTGGRKSPFVWSNGEWYFSGSSCSGNAAKAAA